MVEDPDAWFAPKHFGYGAGLPVAWQGWALLGAYLVVEIGLALGIAARDRLVFLAVTIVLTGALMVIAARHTRGGWHWRWGGRP